MERRENIEMLVMTKYNNHEVKCFEASTMVRTTCRVLQSRQTVREINIFTSNSSYHVVTYRRCYNEVRGSSWDMKCYNEVRDQAEIWSVLRNQQIPTTRVRTNRLLQVCKQMENGHFTPKFLQWTLDVC